MCFCFFFSFAIWRGFVRERSDDGVCRRSTYVLTRPPLPPYMSTAFCRGRFRGTFCGTNTKYSSKMNFCMFIFQTAKRNPYPSWKKLRGCRTQIYTFNNHNSETECQSHSKMEKVIPKLVHIHRRQRKYRQPQTGHGFALNIKGHADLDAYGPTLNTASSTVGSHLCRELEIRVAAQSGNNS